MKHPVMRRTVFLLLLLTIGAPGCAARMTSTTSDESAPRPRGELAHAYREQAQQIIAAALEDDGAWEKLRYLTDHIGHRLSGSDSLESAVDWAVETLAADGHENTRREKVMVPHWERGEEAGKIVAPVTRPLYLLGLGGTIATPEKGIEAPIIVIDDFDQLEERADEVSGKIVLFNKAMPDWNLETGSGYGETVGYRVQGPARAAEHGAVAAMVRSVTATSLRTPHTGSTHYAEDGPKIPAVAVTLEDADLLARLAQSSKDEVRVWLKTSGTWHPDAESGNAIGELVGSQRPEEIVLIGGHIDSWDVGQGAHDDGAGCVIMMQALTLLRELDLRPRRTIRVVLFTNEENGLRGAKGYAEQHADELESHVAGIESDSGGFAPWGFEVQGDDVAQAQVADIVSLLEPVGAARSRKGWGGADLRPLADQGVPGLGLWVDGSRYFDYHHTPADTLDKVDPDDLKRQVAAVAVMAYVLADMEPSLGAPASATH